MPKKLLLLIAFTLSASQGFAYLTLGESAELVPPNQYRLSLEPQLNYYNLSGHVDTGISDDSQIRLSAGVGDKGYHLDYFFKQVPIPDFDDQPALGYRFGVSIARQNDLNVVTPLFYPIISKNFEWEKARFTPYASLPMGISSYRSSSKTPVRLIVGSEYVPTSVENMQMSAEIGFNIKDAFNYFAISFSFYFEPSEQIIDND